MERFSRRKRKQVKERSKHVEVDMPEKTGRNILQLAVTEVKCLYDKNMH